MAGGPEHYYGKRYNWFLWPPGPATFSSRESGTHTTCPWKGQASYYSSSIGDKTEPDAAWYYPEPKEAAKEIKNYVAFYKGVEKSS